ncbi:FAD-dependent oxidoreductase [Desulfospira joergensenii]|uniref:FAD-dependent oxidoreductase n=1 Tax=Desulfospira joergensenii TaxID=53329 RepID=UPI0003B424F8|nr:FAD-dependent oxidoreductase [Desulfospira joergensenii]
MDSASSKQGVIFSTDVRDFGQVAKSVPCQNACPARTNIPGYIRCINEKRYGRAYEINRQANILPGVLGRICSRPCEEACRHGEPDNGQSVGICHLKRSCADLKSSMHRIVEALYAPSGKRVAVVGAGPAGLACAHDLAVLGHGVTIYESREKPGGMLMYGIPEFRLPRDLLMTEINNILRLGIQLKTGQAVGRNINIHDLKEEYEAVVITTGCVSPRKLRVQGEDLDNVYDGLSFMERVNAGEKPFVGKRVVVIGAGFTAVDCARSALRLGAAEVKMNIRKTEDQMRIDETEKHEALFEGIRIHSLVQPSKILGENGKVTGIEFRRTRLETQDQPPSKKAVPIEGSEFSIPCDSVIAALGQSPDAGEVSRDLTGRKADGHVTDMEGVFAAGDFVTGSSDVISAIAGGKKCALAMDEFLTGMVRKKKKIRLAPHTSTDRPRAFDFIPRKEMNTIDMDKRLEDYTHEVEKGFQPDQAHEESKRCYLCNLRYEIDPLRCIYCSACIDVAPKDCIKLVEEIPLKEDGSYDTYKETSQWDRVVSITIDNELCIRCGQCYQVCPMDCISVTKTDLVETDADE